MVAYSDSVVDRRLVPPAGGSSRALRVLLVTPLFYPHMGGIETHVYQVSRRLSGIGVDVTILTTDPAGSLAVDDVIGNARVHRVRSWPTDRDYYFAPGLYEYIRSGTWDIVHVQSYHTLVPPVAMIAALSAELPYVLTFHGGGHSAWIRNRVRVVQRALLRPLLSRARRLVALAEFEVEQYTRELRIPAEKFVVIPNGADLPKIDVSSAPKPSGKTIIASVGRLERYKGHHRLIEAMPHILNARPEVRLWIAGSGPYEADLKRLVQKHGVEAHVEIRAVPPEDRGRMVQELLQVSLVVLLSEYETQPIAVLEAMALGLPVLVADSSGMRELARRGAAHSVSLASTPRQIADAVIEQLDHPLLPTKLKLPTWDDCAMALLELYRAVAEEPASVSAH